MKQISDSQGKLIAILGLGAMAGLATTPLLGGAILTGAPAGIVWLVAAAGSIKIGLTK